MWCGVSECGVSVCVSSMVTTDCPGISSYLSSPSTPAVVTITLEMATSG